MPVSGNEEIGVKPLIVRQSSDYLVGIPIKKRRYPMIRPPSPPAEEAIDPTSMRKDQTSPTRVSASSQPEEVVKPVEAEERKESSRLDVDDHVLGGNTEVKAEEPKSTPSVSLDKVVKAPEFLVANNPAKKIVSAEPNPAASVSVDLGKVKVEAKTSDLLEKTGLLPSERENPRPVSARIDPNQDSPEPVSLNLSLSKTSVVDGMNGGGSSSSRLCEDRANWDLNTPMDAWVGSPRGLALGAQTSLSETNGQRQDVKRLIPVLVTPEKGVDSERKKLTTLGTLPNPTVPQGNSSEDSLLLRLSTPTENLNAHKVIIPSANMTRPIGNLSKAAIGAVKVEPVEECSKQGGKVAETSISVATVVKREIVDQIRLEAPKSIDHLTPQTVDPRPVKPEPVLDSNKQTVGSKEGNESLVQLPDKHSSSLVASTATKTLSSVVNSSCSTENKRSHVPLVLKTTETASACGSSLSTESKLKSCEATVSKTTEIIFPTVNSTGPAELLRCESRLSNSGRPSFTGKTCVKVNFEPGENSTMTSVEPDAAKADDKSEALLSKLPKAFGPGSEEEKVNISAEIEASCGSDYESDGNHAMDMSVDMEIETEEDYEDGEVRESQEFIAAKESLFKKGQQLELSNDNDLNAGAEGNLETVKDTKPSSSNVEVLLDRTCNAETGKDIEGASIPVHGEMGSDRSLYLPESTAIVETPLGGEETNNEALPWGPPDQSGKRLSQEYEERDSKQVTENGDFEIECPRVYPYDMSWSVMSDEALVLKNDPSLAKSATTGVDSDAKDTDNASQPSRIINFPRSSGSSSPSGTRAFSGRMLPSRNGRDRLSDFAPDGDKLHSRGREDIYYDSIHKFSRERHHHHDHTPPRNNRFNFMRGRGRNSNRHDNNNSNLRGGDPEFYSTNEFRVPRHKFADSGLEYNNNSYNESAFVSSNRGGGGGGRPFVRRIPARRRSPPSGGEGGSHLVRRISRIISPNNRIIPDEGSELVVRPRRNVRGSFQDESGVDSVFSYEGVDGHFAGPLNRNFPSSSQQRRVLRRIRSKSPVGSRNRSPGGAWSSPRRRSPSDGFAGGQHHHHHQRSPAQFFRMKNSPERRGFSGEGGVVRRQEMANNRSPSSRIAIRDRRFSGLDTQERPENDDFYGGPMNSNGGDERRFSERRGPVRPYRASFNNTDGEGFHVNSEEGSSRPPLRFCQDDDTEFQERGNNGNLVERDFNRRIKNRPLNAPRRMRNVDEQEVNYRHGNQSSWHNNDFDDMGRVKRKRY